MVEGPETPETLLLGGEGDRKKLPARSASGASDSSAKPTYLASCVKNLFLFASPLLLASLSTVGITVCFFFEIYRLDCIARNMARNIYGFLRRYANM